MSVALAEALLDVAGAYGAIGLAFAIAFALRGAGRIDPGAARGSWGFRLLIVPGATALWPLLARRWLAAHGATPEERDAHVLAARRGAGS